MKNTSAIQNFYENQSIFITGGTGFVGKLLVEKLLRTCDLKKIYLLVRSKKNKTPEERILDLFNLPCFERLNSEKVEYRSKVLLINGDCLQPNLGLTERDINLLTQEVTVVIHAAADVKFNQTLRAAATNLTSTMDMLNIARKMPKLKSFVYVSTAYSNCIHSHIKEDFYEPPMTAENFINMISSLDDDVLEVVAEKLLKNWPNTYVYTKSIIEDYIRRMGKGLPIAITRPAIILSSIEEPIIGWVDNFNGVMGAFIAIGLGLIKSAYLKPDATLQAVPVDYAANQILAAAWAMEKHPNQIMIYNYTSHEKSRITMSKFYDLMTLNRKSLGLSKQILACTTTATYSKLRHDVTVFFLHTCFSYFVDFILFCIGRKPIAVENYQRIDQQSKLTSYFITRDWKFDAENVRKLLASMSDEDRKLFNFDNGSVDWKKYLYDVSIGGRIYLMKDPLETVPQALKRQKILLVIHYVVTALFWYLVYKLVVVLMKILM